jgi:hypothetical protein
MEGTLRFDQDKDDWFVEYEEHFRIVKDDKGQAYDAQTITRRLIVDSFLCPGKYPTDILNHDGTTVNFDTVVFNLNNEKGQYYSARIKQ